MLNELHLAAEILVQWLKLIPFLIHVNLGVLKLIDCSSFYTDVQLPICRAVSMSAY